MGDPRRIKKKYEKPKKPWELRRLAEEREIVKNYGLKNKRELWKALTIIKKYRREVRKILAEIATGKGTEHTRRRGEEILRGLIRRGILNKTIEEAKLDDVLSLSVKDILERRLQTVVFRKGLASSIKHARQLIVHGHIAVKGRKVTVPSYIVSREEENQIGYYRSEDVLEKSSEDVLEKAASEVE
ncbi:MAG: 30S ribosomal protein S4 [Canidatus Methanoxibalbensis ujae]|nr:30S ribosomal protein S4 [Candidatus Methanoxibalbensis ujae]